MLRPRATACPHLCPRRHRLWRLDSGVAHNHASRRPSAASEMDACGHGGGDADRRASGRRRPGFLAARNRHDRSQRQLDAQPHYAAVQPDTRRDQVDRLRRSSRVCEIGCRREKRHRHGHDPRRRAVLARLLPPNRSKRFRDARTVGEHAPLDDESRLLYQDVQSADRPRHPAEADRSHRRHDSPRRTPGHGRAPRGRSD